MTKMEAGQIWRTSTSILYIYEEEGELRCIRLWCNTDSAHDEAGSLRGESLAAMPGKMKWTLLGYMSTIVEHIKEHYENS